MYIYVKTHATVMRSEPGKNIGAYAMTELQRFPSGHCLCSALSVQFNIVDRIVLEWPASLIVRVQPVPNNAIYTDGRHYYATCWNGTMAFQHPFSRSHIGYIPHADYQPETPESTLPSMVLPCKNSGQNMCRLRHSVSQRGITERPFVIQV
jgi:hypothetical protein